MVKYQEEAINQENYILIRPSIWRSVMRISVIIKEENVIKDFWNKKLPMAMIHSHGMGISDLQEPTRLGKKLS